MDSPEAPMARTPKTPKEKKRLSLAKDRRNIYGENSKSSRKNIARGRASGNRKYRRKLKQGLSTDASKFELVVSAGAAKVGRNRWRKIPDISLGDYLIRSG